MNLVKWKPPVILFHVARVNYSLIPWDLCLPDHINSIPKILITTHWMCVFVCGGDLERVKKGLK